MLAATSAELSTFSSKKGITLAIAGSKTSDGGIKSVGSFSSFKVITSDSLFSSASSRSQLADLLSEKVGIKIFKIYPLFYIYVLKKKESFNWKSFNKNSS